MARLSSLARGPSSQTLATSLVSQALTVITGVIAARVLGVEGRGTLAILWLIPVTLVLLGGIGIPQATTYYVARERHNAKGVVAISARLTLGLAVLLAAGYSVGLLLFAHPGQSFSTGQGFLSVGLVPMFLAQNLGVATLLGTKRYRAFNFGRLSPVILYSSGLLVLLLLGHDSLSWILAATVLAWGLAAVGTWTMVFRNLPSSPEPVHTSTGEVARFGLRGVIGSVSPIDDVRVDQIMVGLLMDARALGLYVTALAFCNLPRFIAQSIGWVSFPRIASAATLSDSWKLAGRAFRVGTVAITGCVAILIVAMPFLLPLLFGEEFSDAIPIGRILLAAALFLSIHRLLTELARGLGHPGYGSITELVNLAVFLLAVAILATPASTSGIALAVLAGGIASSALLAYLLRRLRRTQAASGPAGG